MEQGRPARDPVVVEVWGEARAKVGVEWVGHSPQGQAEIVYAPTADNKSLISSDNLAIKKCAQNVVRQ